MRLGYADPPYLGYASFYRGLHPNALDYDDPETHRALIARLCGDYDGWALSLTSTNLHDILPMCPRTARIAAWVKPFASFKPGVNPGYTWEPVIFRSARARTDKSALTVRDHLSCPITLERGLTGAKPDRFNRWVLDLMGYVDGDEVVDLFPGTGGMARTVAQGVLL